MSSQPPKPYNHTITFEGESIGTCCRAAETYPEGWGLNLPPTSYGLYCPECGVIWFTSRVSPRTLGWRYHPRPCPKHGFGSLYFEPRLGLFQSLPKSLLLRELQLALDFPDRWHGAIIPSYRT